MKKHTLLLVFILTMVVTAFAESVTVQTAQTAAQSFLNSKMSHTPELTLIDFPEKAEFTNFYVFGDEHCFVIIAADDCVHPVLGYSTKNAFGTEEMSENVYGWLKAYNEDIALAVNKNIEANADIRAEWGNLLTGQCLQPKSRTSVEPLVRTTWGQSSAPFNNLCPIDPDGPNGHAHAGCIATSMAQILNYWEHPTRGVGTHSYTPYGHPEYGVQYVDFGATVYDWDNMKNNYSNEYTDEEANAVATLMYHCGVAVDMRYGPSSSGAYGIDELNAYKMYFDYNSNIEWIKKSEIFNDSLLIHYTDEQWIIILKNELDLMRPLPYGGSSIGLGGHAFICDGYDENNLFHFNWGWCGSYDGYYIIGNLTPGSSSFNDVNDAIFYCFPNNPSINPPSNISTTVNGNNVSVQWSSVGNASSYKLYRDSDLVASNITATNYTENNVLYGTHYYYIKSVKSDGTMSLWSNTAIADVHFSGPIPTNLQASENGDAVDLTWQSPTSGSTILQYGTGDVISGAGIQEFYWAQRFPKSDLCLYAGMAINKVSVYFRKSGTYTLFIYKGNDAFFLATTSPR